MQCIMNSVDLCALCNAMYAIVCMYPDSVFINKLVLVPVPYYMYTVILDHTALTWGFLLAGMLLFWDTLIYHCPD